MSKEDIQHERPSATERWQALQRHRGKFILGAVLVSLLAHAVSMVELGQRRHQKIFSLDQANKPPVKIRVVPVPPKQKPQDDDLASKKILETPQQKTETPDDARFLGTVDHKAKQEMRLPDNQQREKAKDPGQKGNPEAKPEAKIAETRPKQDQPEASPKQSDVKIKERTGRLSVEAYTPDRKPRNNYEALLPTSVADLPGQVTAGFQDYVDDKILEGDRIDISTSEYRYIGYFTSMRKAIELVWTYPQEASRRHMQGEVGLEFAINKDGRASRIRVIKSSGYPILDRAIVEAIKLASPFSPLPDGFRRDKIVVTGSFRYILSAYGSH